MARLAPMVVLLSALVCLVHSGPPASTRVPEAAVALRKLVASGGRVAWYQGSRHDLIAFDAVADDRSKNTELHLVRPDGSERRCLTCDVAAIRKGFVGQPAWHPDGEHLVIQVENRNSDHRFYNHVSWGIDNDLWVVDRHGQGAQLLWNTPDKHAALHPHLSPDGRRIVFAERVPTGEKLRGALGRLGPGGENQWAGWRIHIADVELAGEQGRLSNHRTLQPNGPGFYETHGFTPTGRMTYSFTPGGEAYVEDSYEAALDGSGVRNLTRSPGTWEEHAQYSPDGPRLAFISSRMDPALRFPASRARDLRTELFVQDGDSEARQLTDMNGRGEGRLAVSDFDWDRDGGRIVFQVARVDGSRHPELWIAEWKDAPVAPGPPGARVSVLTSAGGHLDWLRDGPIAFDRAGADGYFDLWVMNPDGSQPRNMTEGRKELPGLHAGQPAWHPSGRFIAFQAQKRGIPTRFEKTSEPGAGVLNDLWLMDAEGARFWKLVDLPFDLSPDSPGILHPHFSHDGRKLLWAERVGRSHRAFGSWVMRLADFSFDAGEPRLANIVTLTPGQERPPRSAGAFYETHGFSPDDRQILYSSNVERGLKLYELELSTGRIRRFTDDPRVWDEHAQYSPDGSRIVYMSSEGLVFQVQPFELQTEFWLMNRDGSGRRRLTYFHEPGHPHYRGGGFAVAADSAWRADGTAFAGLVIRHRPDSARRGEGEIVLVEPQ